MADYHILGSKITRKNYTLEETKCFHKALDKSDFATFVRSFKWEDKRYSKHIEGVEFDIETSAFSKSNILNTERTCVIFAKDEKPMVFALRKDFPREMLHVNLLQKDLPVSPCLYEEPYSEIRLWLTWESFIERVSRWFMRASDGTAHLPNQALEPLILDGTPLLVSKRFFDTEKIYVASNNSGVMHCYPMDWQKNLPKNIKIIIPIKANPTVTRHIHYAPTTYKELAELTEKLGFDLWEKIFEFTGKIEEQLSAIPNIEEANRLKKKEAFLSWEPLVWLRLPKKRADDDKKEWDEDIAFSILKCLGDLCEEMGIYTKHDGCMVHEKNVPGANTIKPEITNEIANVLVVKPIPILDISMAQKLSGLEKKTKKYLALGVGALGSQVVTNLTRLGIGKWDVLDRDRLLPHNLSRHALFAPHSGSSKAIELSNQLNLLMDDPNFSKPIPCDFLDYESSIADYDLIFDFSASTATMRHLATRPKRPAIVSAFMTQKGKYLMCLSEGDAKSIRVDDIEYQLACACINNKDLNQVLEIQNEQEIRYSGACSDITTVLPQDRVAIHSGIVSSYIKQRAKKSKPKISVWEFTDNCSVNHYDIPLSMVKSTKVKDWDMRISENVIAEMMDFRSAKLPLETGGVLIGGFDLHNKIVYIADIIPSPKDSVEEPYSYIRGFEGLAEKLEEIKRISGRRLDYVGEWHAHQHGVTPSELDKKALKEQTEEMSLAGLPGIMVIIGKKSKYKILLNQK